MKSRIIRNARTIASALLGLYLVLMSAGLALEIAAGSYFAGGELLSAVAEFILMTVWSIVGVLIVSRQPQHPVGWVWLLTPIIVAMDNLAWGYAYFGLFTNPGSLPGVNLMILWNYWTGRTVGLVPLTVLFLMFPTGRPLSSGWGMLAWIAAGAVAVHVPLAAVAPYPISYFPFPRDILGASESIQSLVSPLRWITGAMPVLCALLATLSLMLRLHQSRGVERQQIKWFVYAAAFFIPGTFLIIFSGIQDILSQNLLFTIGVGLTLISITGMSVTSAIAILRYRLWDIDIIIRRTLQYSFLSVTLISVYLAVVFLLQNIFTAISGQTSPIAIVISTLVIAALFNPLRVRLQDFIDRRFFRRKYNTELLIDRFSRTARDEPDLEVLSMRLIKVVQDTMEPEQISFWLRE